MIVAVAAVSAAAVALLLYVAAVAAAAVVSLLSAGGWRYLWGRALYVIFFYPHVLISYVFSDHAPL